MSIPPPLFLLRLLFLLRAAVPAAAALCTSPSPADVMENALPSIVQILTDSGSGSGFIVNDGGLVVTNQHVVEGSRNIRVRLGTGRITYPGEVVERDPRLDLAYVQIDSRLEFTPIAIGDSDEIRVGEEVIAIGFPLGSELGDDATITTGVILAKREDLDFLQTDASLNPGNSGGPLLNGYGYVVGVNTAGIEESDGRTISGINFAIPINEIKKPLGSQITSGQPACGSTAASSQNLTLAPTPLTDMPTPTNTPVPTFTPSPTSILAPTAEPTLTPVPTPTQVPTATPAPTTTPVPTPTPVPTATPEPTATPVPKVRWGDISVDKRGLLTLSVTISWRDFSPCDWRQHINKACKPNVVFYKDQVRFGQIYGYHCESSPSCIDVSEKEEYFYYPDPQRIRLKAYTNIKKLDGVRWDVCIHDNTPEHSLLGCIEIKPD